MILMCRTSPHKNNMGAYVVRTFLGLIKIIQNLYDDYVKIARNCMILMVADAQPLDAKFYTFNSIFFH